MSFQENLQISTCYVQKIKYKVTFNISVKNLINMAVMKTSKQLLHVSLEKEYRQ